MKRSPMPRRRTPLRGRRYQMPHSTKPLRIAAHKGKREHYADLRVALHARAGGLCERCGDPAPLDFGECHHRQKRSRQGRDDMWNCVWTCHDCNNRWIETHVAEATATGWLVPSWAEPREWPCLRGDAWQQPTPAGWTPAAPRQEQVA